MGIISSLGTVTTAIEQPFSSIEEFTVFSKERFEDKIFSVLVNIAGIWETLVYLPDFEHSGYSWSNAGTLKNFLTSGDLRGSVPIQAVESEVRIVKEVRKDYIDVSKNYLTKIYGLNIINTKEFTLYLQMFDSGNLETAVTSLMIKPRDSLLLPVRTSPYYTFINGLTILCSDIAYPESQEKVRGEEYSLYAEINLTSEENRN